jgi:glycosyltransferase involved in cell wall biosynthesis
MNMEPGLHQSANVGTARKRRVLIVVENLPVPFDRRVWSEARTLAANGYEVSVICPKGRDAAGAREVVGGIHIYRHWLPAEARSAPGYFLEYAAALFWEFALSFRVLTSHGFDVIHACNPPDTIFLIGAFYKYLFGKRFVFDHHDINPELFEAKFGHRGPWWRLMVWLERLSFAVADISIATNQSYRAIAIERGGMRPENVFVVRSGPDLKRVKEAPPDAKWKNGRRYLVAYVGVIGKQEGLDLLLDAARHIRRRGRDDVQFIVAGSGPELENVKKLAMRDDLADMVNFTGRVDDETLFGILSTADVCVNPDRPNAMNDKSTMNKIMEYMALGKPIVQFDLVEGRYSAGEASVYVRKTDTVEFGDRILELLDDPVRRRAMGEAGKARVRKELAWEHEAPNLLAAYDAVFASPGEQHDADARRRAAL